MIDFLVSYIEDVLAFPTTLLLPLCVYFKAQDSFRLQQELIPFKGFTTAAENASGCKAAFL